MDATAFPCLSRFGYAARPLTHGWEFLTAGVVSFALSCGLTRGMIWLAPRIGFVDKPGHRKIHAKPKPLGPWEELAQVLLVSGEFMMIP